MVELIPEVELLLSLSDVPLVFVHLALPSSKVASRLEDGAHESMPVPSSITFQRRTGPKRNCGVAVGI